MRLPVLAAFAFIQPRRPDVLERLLPVVHDRAGDRAVIGGWDRTTLRGLTQFSSEPVVRSLQLAESKRDRVGARKER